jgi:hypothetical protein
MDDKTPTNFTEYQQNVSKFVEGGVIYLVSPLVNKMATHSFDECSHLLRGFNIQEAKHLLAEIHQSYPDNADEWKLRESLQRHNIDPDQCEYEVYEHWLISDYLASRLEERDEVIDLDFYGLTVWGRCATGQLISLDPVIQDIYNSLH